MPAGVGRETPADRAIWGTIRGTIANHGRGRVDPAAWAYLRLA
jgi:hypothetical protein